ncbi:MAG: ABC transporter substrate-binding protein [Alphaproteobacteria bacterium]|nr:ABC transporter substrate-binding protein [Alphaproteobacteria bacterium]
MNRRTVSYGLLFSLFVLAGLWSGDGYAQSKAEGAKAFVIDLGERTINFLSDSSSPIEAREKRLRELLREGFAVDRIGRFVLGKYRRTAPPEKVEEFVDVFEDYIVALYASQFTRYGGEKFEVQKVVNTSRAKDSMVVTKILPADGQEPLRVDFQVRNLGDAYKIMDVRIEGVSMVLAQRDEFSAYIAKNGGSVDALISALRQRIASFSKKTAQHAN